MLIILVTTQRRTAHRSRTSRTARAIALTPAVVARASVSAQAQLASHLHRACAPFGQRDHVHVFYLLRYLRQLGLRVAADWLGRKERDQDSILVHVWWELRSFLRF